MGLRDELIEEECFSVDQNAATLTIKEKDTRTMIPWITFKHGIWKDRTINLHFQEWAVVIEGQNLSELWSELQQQRVLSIRKLPSHDEDSCFIRSLSISKKETDADIGDVA